MYRIYTEDVNRELIEQIVADSFDGYTLLPATGVWKGAREQSVVIELSTEDKARVFETARQIKAANKQEAVLVDYVADEAVLV